MTSHTVNSSLPDNQRFRQLKIIIYSAELKDLGYLAKSGPFVEIRSDNVFSAQKTDFAKKSLRPIWDDSFSVLVKLDSEIEFRICNLHFVKPINTIGTAKVWNYVTYLLLFRVFCLDFLLSWKLSYCNFFIEVILKERFNLQKCSNFEKLLPNLYVITDKLFGFLCVSLKTELSLKCSN